MRGCAQKWRSIISTTVARCSIGQKVRRPGIVSSSGSGSSSGIGLVSRIVGGAGIRMVSFELSVGALGSATRTPLSRAGMRILSGSERLSVSVKPPVLFLASVTEHSAVTPSEPRRLPPSVRPLAPSPTPSTEDSAGTPSKLLRIRTRFSFLLLHSITFHDVPSP